jgi:tetratricopeptide (TPR) repeat protein
MQRHLAVEQDYLALRRGICRADLGKFEDAKEDFLQQLQIEWMVPGKVQILSTLAAIDWHQGEKQSAIARVEEALRLVEAQENVDENLRIELANELDDLRAQV